jgi:hypothetical protein
VKEKVKPAEVLHELNAQRGEETLSQASACGWFSKLSEAPKFQDKAVSWQDHGKCVPGFRRTGSC